jgi:hypothetical protein
MPDHNIRIGKNERIVLVSIVTDLASESEIHFSHECSSGTEAELLCNYLRDRQHKKIQGIRKAEFFSGWKHGRAKKHGKKWFSWFSGCLNEKETYE